MASSFLSGFNELTSEWRQKRDGKDCTWNVIVTVAEARGLRGLGNHGLNDCRLKVTISTELDDARLSKIHEKTCCPFFDQVFKLTFEGQPASFFQSHIQVEILHERAADFPQNIVFPPKSIGMIQVGILDIFQMPEHKLPMQWFAIVDLFSEEPAIPRGFLRMSIIVNSLDESGAVQIDVPLQERNEKELLVIPRMHACTTSTGAYNIIFQIYQARDLRRMDNLWGADPYIRVSCSSGEMRTDTKHGTVNPKWNQQIQLPLYEPMFREVILFEVWHEGPTGPLLMSTLLFTWKDIVSNQEIFKQLNWYDMYELPEESLATKVLKTKYVKWIGRQAEELSERLRNNQVVKWVERQKESIAGTAAVKKKTGIYQASSIYCGRVLLSISVEDRTANLRRADKLPSLAQTDMKPKDCAFFQSVQQKAFFRLQVFFAQGLPVPFGLDSLVQVELTIGSPGKRATTEAVRSDGDLFQWYQSVELELDLLYDDALWPWSCDASASDYELGLVPSDFIDHGIPDAWIKVYRCSAIGHMNTWTNDQTRKLIGFRRCSIRELLCLGVAKTFQSPSGPRRMDNVNSEDIGAMEDEVPDKRNLILNQKQSSQPAFALKDADSLPRFFDPATFPVNHKSSLACPAWPAPHGEEYATDLKGVGWPGHDDKRGNKNSMDPYIGVQCLELERDGTCALDDGDFPGRIWVSCKCYLPSRENCKSAIKGPPILSPFTKYNRPNIPEPSKMAGCIQRFSLRCHIFQASDLPASNAIGIADSYVEVVFMGRRSRTHIVYGSNSPTWDVTLSGGALNDVEIPCLGWPGRRFTYDDMDVQSEYDVAAEPGIKYDPNVWRRNQEMLRFVPWIEVRVEEAGGVLLGRCFIEPSKCLHTLQDPKWYELFKGNPNLDEGKILVSMQLMHKTDPLLSYPAIEPFPIRTDQLRDKDNAWRASDRDSVGTHIQGTMTKKVMIRECRVQIQILGLRSVDESVQLTNPSIALFIQTTDKWDADKNTFQATQSKSGGDDHQDQNFMETLELQVLLPDDIEYAPHLEFVVYDDCGSFGWSTKREIVAWGSKPLADFYPQGSNSSGEILEREEEEEDEAAIKRQEAKELSKQFRSILQDFEGKQTFELKDSKQLKAKFDENTDEKNPVRAIAKKYTEAPSEAVFVETSEIFLVESDPQIKKASRKRGTVSTVDQAAKENEQHIPLQQQPQQQIATNSSSGDDAVQQSSFGQQTSATVTHADMIHAAPSVSEPPITLRQTTEALPVEEADTISNADSYHEADNPQQARYPDLEKANTIQDDHQDDSMAVADDTQNDFYGTDHVEPQDDEEADMQEVIDTPDGKPSPEWLMFRKNKLYNEPLENSEEWRKKLLDPFDEIALFRGRVWDYKRREACKLGIIKCQIKVFRKEDEDEKGKSKRSLGKKDATFYETMKSDTDMEKALDKARPYRMNNIYETYPDATVDVRLYCLKAIQVTPGGFRRTDAVGTPYWNHYLECRLGSQNLGRKYESDVANKLNPNFFHMFEIKGITLPGPSQLIVSLKDGEVLDGSIIDSRLIGETTIDLEDRWFCPDWRDLIHKPREVRDLVNEKDQPGISQGKLLVVLDMVEEVLVEDSPPMDIQVQLIYTLALFSQIFSGNQHF